MYGHWYYHKPEIARSVPAQVVEGFNEVTVKWADGSQDSGGGLANVKQIGDYLN